MTMGTATIQRRDSSTLKKAVEFEALITSEYAVLFNVAAKFYSNEADIYDVLLERSSAAGALGTTDKSARI